MATVQFDEPPGMRNNSITMIHSSLQRFPTAILPFCVSINTENHMCHILPATCADKGNVYKNSEVCVWL